MFDQKSLDIKQKSIVYSYLIFEESCLDIYDLDPDSFKDNEYQFTLFEDRSLTCTISDNLGRPKRSYSYYISEKVFTQINNYLDKEDNFLSCLRSIEGIDFNFSTAPTCQSIIFRDSKTYLTDFIPGILGKFMNLSEALIMRRNIWYFRDLRYKHKIASKTYRIVTKVNHMLNIYGLPIEYSDINSKKSTLEYIKIYLSEFIALAMKQVSLEIKLVEKTNFSVYENKDILILIFSDNEKEYGSFTFPDIVIKKSNPNILMIQPQKFRLQCSNHLYDNLKEVDEEAELPFLSFFANHVDL